MFWKKEDNPKITFRAREDLEGIFPKPQRASKFMPDWFKKLNKDIADTGPAFASTVKRCVPVLDAIRNGYIIPLWADLHVKVSDTEDEEGNTQPHIWFQFPDTFGFQEILGGHGWEQVGDGCPLDKFEYGKILMKFVNPWVIETSPGYSVLFKTPPHQYSPIHLSLIHI